MQGTELQQMEISCQITYHGSLSARVDWQLNDQPELPVINVTSTEVDQTFRQDMMLFPTAEDHGKTVSCLAGVNNTAFKDQCAAVFNIRCKLPNFEVSSTFLV